MKLKIENIRAGFIIGLILLLISLFLDWYVFQVFNKEGTLIASWVYNPFSEWSSNSIFYDEQLKPNDLLIPFTINITMILVISLSAYGMIFKNLKHEDDLNKLYPFACINIFLLLLMGFYIFIFPIAYLLSNELYFPFLMLVNIESENTYYYSIGPGYILHVLAFGLIYPLSIFYYQTIVNFEIKRLSPAVLIENYITRVHEPINLDKFIAEEELKQKFRNNDSKRQNNQIFKSFIE